MKQIIFLFFICISDFVYSMRGVVNIDCGSRDIQIYHGRTRQLELESFIDLEKLVEYSARKESIYVPYVLKDCIHNNISKIDLYNLSSTDYRLIVDGKYFSFIRFLTTQIEFCSRFFTYLPGSICLLIGTSSAGKSSILSYLNQEAIKSAQQDRFLFTGEDLSYLDGIVSVVRKIAPSGLKGQLETMDSDHLFQCFFTSLGEFVCGSELMRKYDEILSSNAWALLKKKWLTVEKIFEENLEKIRYERTISALKKGYTILDDVACIPLYLRMMFSNFMVCKINTVVVYCSPERLLERVIYRNAKDVLHPNKELRLFFPFNYFKQLYVPTDDSNAIAISKSSIESISFEKSMRSLINAIPDGYLSADRKMLQEMISNGESFQFSHRQYILDQWFKSADTAYITPAFPYDLILDNGIYSLEQICKIMKPILGFK